MPTILAEIEYKYPYPDNLMIYGTDFNISYQAVGSEEKIDKQILTVVQSLWSIHSQCLKPCEIVPCFAI